MSNRREELRKIHIAKFAFRKLAKVEIEDIIFNLNNVVPLTIFSEVINATTEQLASMTDGQRFTHSRRSLQLLLQQYDVTPVGNEQVTVDDFKLTLKGA